MLASDLHPLLVVLGGVRIIGQQEFSKRQKPRRRTRDAAGAAGLELSVHQKQHIRFYDDWLEAKRFLRNAYRILSDIYYVTPLGHIALASRRDDLLEAYELLLSKAVSHNVEFPHWQVLMELSWTDLGPEGVSALLTYSAEKLPAVFWRNREEATAA